MNKYESVIIIRPDKTDDEIKLIIEDMKNLVIKNNGNFEKVENLGLKKLAYEIRKCKEGYYAVLYFEADASVITELERMYRITEDIIKFMTIRKDEDE